MPDENARETMTSTNSEDNDLFVDLPSDVQSKEEDIEEVVVHVFFAHGTGEKVQEEVEASPPPESEEKPARSSAVPYDETVDVEPVPEQLPSKSAVVPLPLIEQRPAREVPLAVPVENPQPLVRSSETSELPPPPQKRRGIPSGILFILAAVLTVIILGGALLVVGYLTDNLPAQIAALLTPAADAPLAPGSGASAAPQPTPTTALIEPTDAPTAVPTTIPAGMPTDSSTEAPTNIPARTLTPDAIVLSGVEMVLVSGSTYEMGSADDAHSVSLAPYYIDRFEITNAAWQACVSDGGCQRPASSTDYAGNPYYDDPDHWNFPVIYVDWAQVEGYCRWRGARLPTEAEWEMAARWNPDTEAVVLFPWGDVFDPQRLNYCDSNCPLETAERGHDDGWAQTAPVGSYPLGASALGVHDMAGNVAEWTADWYAADYYDISPIENPLGPLAGESRVVRGGAWGISNPEFLKSTFRSRFEPALTGPGVGGRCAISVSDVNQ